MPSHRASTPHRAPTPRRASTPRLSAHASVGVAIIAILVVCLLAVRSWVSAHAVDLPGPEETALALATQTDSDSNSGGPSDDTSPDLSPDDGAAPGPSAGNYPGDTVPSPGHTSPTSSTGDMDDAAGQSVVVHVTGAVAEPGVFELPAGSRIDDAIVLAGGFAPDANEAGLNRALVLQDGQQVAVPRIGESPSLPPHGVGGGGAGTGGSVGGGGGSVGTGGGSGGSGTGGLININTATPAELEELPGIGPALAGAIIRHREQVGGFTDVDELDDVPGIGPATLGRLRDLVTV